MAGANRNLTQGKNPFYDERNGDEDEVDDMTFLSSKPSNYVLGNGHRNTPGDYDMKRQQLLDERRRIEERTLQSSKMSLGLVYESEKVGLSTAEELIRQGEKLQKVDQNLDTINSTMRVTQKHLTSMKSLFGGIKNYFGSKPADANAPLPGSKSVPGISSQPNLYKSQLTDTLEQVSRDTNVRSANMNRAGFSFDETSSPSEPSAGGAKGRSEHTTRSGQVDKQLDENLSELGLGLGRLKNLALGLGNEIESQNEMLDGITNKAERADFTIGHQNRQMKHILKK